MATHQTLGGPPASRRLSGRRLAYRTGRRDAARAAAGTAAVLVVALLCAMPLIAQTTASLTGTVSSNDAPLANARVIVRSASLQGERTAVTAANGAYLFPALPPGDYSVRVVAEGHPEVRRDATLELAQTTRVDILFATAETAAQVAPAIESKPVATSLPLEAIEKLPVQRNQLATAQLAPGVSSNTLSNGVLQISGGPGYDNLVTVNGVVVNENTRGQMRPLYVEDAIDETTVLTGAISAEYGRFTGGVISTITKQGSNQLSGSVRDSLGNPSWSAQSPANEDREDHLNHVFEATLGGPLLRDRVWFFTAGRWAKNDMARQTIAIPATTAGNVLSPASPQLSYSESNDQKRYEGKITASPLVGHTLIGSYFGIDTSTENSRFANNIYDEASLTERDDPDSLLALRWSGVFGDHMLAEIQLSRRQMSLSSGALSHDLIAGTVVLDRANQNARFNAPSLCGICEPEERDNDDVLVKVNYFTGTHRLVAGADRFTERHLLDDRQSGSDFSVFVTRAQWKDGVIYPVITPTNANGGGTFIRWSPVAVAARENELRTDSLFVNDTWDLGARWNLTAGARYDRNHAEDSDGVVTADDARFSPRLGVQYDLRGDGRQRVSASYGEYSSRVADAIASSNQTAGSSAAIDYAYRGPAINQNALTVPLAQALEMLFAYFNGQQGGTGNTSAQNLRPTGSRVVPGYSTYFDGTLSTPYVRETTLGYGADINTNRGARGYVRVDLVARDWRDFYALEVTQATQRTTTPLGIPVDLALVRNTNDIERTYRGIHLQGRWSASRFDAGMFYTWSKLRGNDEGETANGPVANFVPSIYYPEFMEYERHNPTGYLRGDQRHRVRAWAGVTLGDFEASVLQTFDSGQAYSISLPINVTRYAGAPANPGYASIPNGRYYLTGRGALRGDDWTSTNLALRYRYRFLFAQADVLNVFNEDAIADPLRLGSGVTTAANSQTLQPFDPRTTTPVEGTHYQLASNFGQPVNNLAYQTPRTFRISLGARF